MESSPADLEFREDGHVFLVASSTQGPTGTPGLPSELLVYLYR